ncbi:MULTISPECIES: DUF2750 domain-containing protein [unclassified Chitinophaga]|uniref:DUF2750 domain-containing protein n=1 Tax=unclassified Chitinophaga TaxID=2619133 RepID=UPI0009C5CA86|nr:MULTISPECIES: DUF2750 domain-containing protein [unclassified Chitinophaga]OMP79381.1 hypothetical protein BW716_09810 [[Flexibacter] sp. ATCC 35208]WPV66025.1 DUF2750 domain-containing protein [Chitinophaga sp. LS1]
MINEKEINSMINQDANTRLEYTIKRIVDLGVVWFIERDKKLVLLNDEFSNIIVPIWPFKEFADLFAEVEYADCKVNSVSMDDFLKFDIPIFQRENFKISLFPLNTGKGSVIEIDLFLNLVNEEMDKY